VFTSFFAWAYPTVLRNWRVVATAFGLTEDSKQIVFEISFGVRGRRKRIGQVEVTLAEEDIGNTVFLPLANRFEKPGIYVVHISIPGTDERLRVPLQVVSARWPEFTDEDLEELRSATNLPKGFKATVDCIECGHLHVLEGSPLPEYELQSGVLSFPESGWIKCGGCGRRVHVKDLEGQMLSAIHGAITRARDGSG